MSESDKSQTRGQPPEAQCAECSWELSHDEANERVRETGKRMVEVINRKVKLHKHATGHKVR